MSCTVLRLEQSRIVPIVHFSGSVLFQIQYSSMAFSRLLLHGLFVQLDFARAATVFEDTSSTAEARARAPASEANFEIFEVEGPAPPQQRTAGRDHVGGSAAAVLDLVEAVVDDASSGRVVEHDAQRTVSTEPPAPLEVPSKPSEISERALPPRRAGFFALRKKDTPLPRPAESSGGPASSSSDPAPNSSSTPIQPVVDPAPNLSSTQHPTEGRTTSSARSTSRLLGVLAKLRDCRRARNTSVVVPAAPEQTETQKLFEQLLLSSSSSTDLFEEEVEDSCLRSLEEAGGAISEPVSRTRTSAEDIRRREKVLGSLFEEEHHDATKSEEHQLRDLLKIEDQLKNLLKFEEDDQLHDLLIKGRGTRADVGDDVAMGGGAGDAKMAVASLVVGGSGGGCGREDEDVEELLRGLPAYLEDSDIGFSVEVMEEYQRARERAAERLAAESVSAPQEGSGAGEIPAKFREAGPAKFRMDDDDDFADDLFAEHFRPSLQLKTLKKFLVAVPQGSCTSSSEEPRTVLGSLDEFRGSSDEPLPVIRFAHSTFHPLLRKQAATTPAVGTRERDPTTSGPDSGHSEDHSAIDNPLSEFYSTKHLLCLLKDAAEVGHFATFFSTEAAHCVRCVWSFRYTYTDERTRLPYPFGHLHSIPSFLGVVICPLVPNGVQL